MPDADDPRRFAQRLEETRAADQRKEKLLAEIREAESQGLVEKRPEVPRIKVPPRKPEKCTQRGWGRPGGLDVCRNPRVTLDRDEDVSVPDLFVGTDADHFWLLRTLEEDAHAVKFAAENYGLELPNRSEQCRRVVSGIVDYCVTRDLAPSQVGPNCVKVARTFLATLPTDTEDRSWSVEWANRCVGVVESELYPDGVPVELVAKPPNPRGETAHIEQGAVAVSAPHPLELPTLDPRDSELPAEQVATSDTAPSPEPMVGVPSSTVGTGAKKSKARGTKAAPLTAQEKRIVDMNDSGSYSTYSDIATKVGTTAREVKRIVEMVRMRRSREPEKLSDDACQERS